jgi:hypothetical protein
MIGRRTIILTCLVALCASQSFAGPLSTDPNAYFDGSTTWHGSTPFSHGTLTGFIDWAVYDPAHAPAGLAGYARTPGELIYAYQAYDTGASALSSVSVDLQNFADNIGTFTATGIGGQAALTANLVPLDSATWTFTGVLTGNSTVGMVFSSPMVPMNDVATTLDHGQVVVVDPIPSPSSIRIPEPSTLVLALFGLAGFAFRLLQRRGQRAGVIG